MSDQVPIIQAKNLTKHFPIYGGFFRKQIATVHAVEGISFDIIQGEIFGLVGESGCGKTTTGRTILRLVEPTAGDVYFRDNEITKLDKKQLRDLRRDMQIVFQDPLSSLNPRMTVFRIISEPMVNFGIPNRKDRILELMQMVELELEYLYRYPHMFSGGQKQRIAIARALSIDPSFIVLDEPVASVDVSIRAGLLNLMMSLRDKLGLTYLFISHDLSVVRYFCDRVSVMYLGKIVELSETNELFENPLHPYTEALLSATPVPDPRHKSKRIILTGTVPSAINPPSGCRFHTRCRYAQPICAQEEPELRAMKGNHLVACHFADSLKLVGA